jgi:hypothetical protein
MQREKIHEQKEVALTQKDSAQWLRTLAPMLKDLKLMPILMLTPKDMALKLLVIHLMQKVTILRL